MREKKERRVFFAARRKQQLRRMGDHPFRAINTALYQLISTHKSLICAGYYPIRDEISVLPALENLQKKGVSIALPIVLGENQPLIFKQWLYGETLEKGAFNIPEPADQARILIPDCVIVPLLAFDDKGYRLGYGGGFYDRTLARLREKNTDLLTVGVAFEILKSPDLLPIDEYDQSLDYIVTEEKIIKFND